jgi:kynurenine formamidase
MTHPSSGKATRPGEIPYCHMEKLCNLEQLPDHGFIVACFPYKVKRGSAGWTRAVALFD